MKVGFYSATTSQLSSVKTKAQVQRQLLVAYNMPLQPLCQADTYNLRLTCRQLMAAEAGCHEVDSNNSVQDVDFDECERILCVRQLEEKKPI